MKQTIKSRLLDWVESQDSASFTAIIEQAHDLKHGVGSWSKNPNRRGWFSDAFTGQWRYDRPNDQHRSYQIGYMVRRGVKSGWLEKQPNGLYKTVRYKL
jgi:hypothetical protein